MSAGTEIGAMDQLVLVQSCEITTSSQGAKRYVFSDHSRVFANVVENSNEMVRQGNLADVRSLSVTIYKIDGLTPRWRLIIDGRPYSITSIDAISRTSPLCTLRAESINDPL